METTNTIPPTLPNNNSSSRRKQSKPNRLEHSTVDLIEINPAEHDHEQSDRVSLNCEDGSSTSPSTTNDQYPLDENLTQTNDTILDFSLKTNLNPDQTRLVNISKKSRSLKRKHPNGNTQLQDEKIFHPDAFCGICQKEFCNKYFLKTHLANKHGIFDQESTNAPSISALSSLIQSDDNENDINNNNQISHLSEEDGDEQDGTGAITSIINENEQITNPSTTSSKLLEDFCEICQKHFCNKYYLRKHKLDVHGVQTDCNIKSYKSKTSTTSTTTSPSPLNLNLLLNPIFSTDSISQRRFTDSSNDSSIISKSSYPLSDVYQNQISPCHLCGKKFQSNEYLQLHLMNKHQISNLIKRIKLEPNETTNTNPTLSSSSPTPIVETYIAAKMIDRVSCDICHKQICNKYFLKTHKFKVHGIGSDPNVPTTTTEDEKSPEQIPSENESQIESSEQILCEICSKIFPSKFLLHIHMTNVHGMQSPEISTKTSIKLKQTPQVQLRVTCQVCKKELCNKYFLRAHMRNVHNQNLDENSFSNDTKKFDNTNSTELLSMQAFLVESDDQLYKDSFVPCMVYLPCRQRVDQTIEISLRLQPIESNK